MTRGHVLFCVCMIGASALAGEKKFRIREPEISENERKHWAFRPLTRPQIPTTKAPSGINNPIDRFILARLEKANLRPLPTANRPTLIRRLTFDLLGLPPTIKQVQRFVQDSSPSAYAKLVDRLLVNPAYGERWAQHWLDLARFAETDGFEHDHVRKEAWRYRDWVIEALNRDLPYDEFVRLQIAGDLLKPDQNKTHVATGFLMSGPDMPDINLVEERRHVLLNEMASNVGSVFLGLTLECAQCHDHKYDPLSQGDFYRFRAFFSDVLPNLKRFKQHPMTVRATSKPTTSRFVIRGDFRRPGPVVKAAFPRIVAQKPVISTEPRKALAFWLTKSDHPLTARVMANRLWLHHFGKPLAGMPSDFGILSDEPTHPQLLDWLATELVRNDWSLKRIHRLMVTSQAYQRASRSGLNRAIWDRLMKADPNNLLLGRMNRRRLDGESIRDAMLSCANLTSFKRGGAGARPPLPKKLVEALLKNQWNVSPNREDHYRRSIYVFARRNLRYPIFEAFDRPDGNASCAKRSKSTTAPQALILLNSQFSQRIAQTVAADVRRQSDKPKKQIRLCYQRLLARSPREIELKIGLGFLKVHQKSFKSNRSHDQLQLSVLSDYCLALLNLNEFTHID